MLFKEILEQPRPTKGPSSSKLNKCGKTHKKATKLPAQKLYRGGTNARYISGGRKGVSSAQVNSRAPRPSKGIPKAVASGKVVPKTKFDSNVPSSTPVFTPIKKDKLPSSISSSQCSLIELLQQYNTFSSEQKAYDSVVLEKTLTPQPAQLSPVKEDVNPQLQTFKEVLRNLLHSVDSDASVENGKIEHAFEDVQAAYRLLHKSTSSNSLKQSTLAAEPNTSNVITMSNPLTNEELLRENSSLQQQLQSVKKELSGHKSLSSTSDFSLELMTLQCQNKALEQKVSELTIALEQALCLQHSIVDSNSQLKLEKERLQSELSLKHDELAKSGDLFSSETREIKKDVYDALQKVENLKLSLEETNKSNQGLMQKVQSKDNEIIRLNELNKGLQRSVSRLLEDLKKASKPAGNEINITSEVLKKVDQFLSSPTRKEVTAGLPNNMKFKSPAVTYPDLANHERYFTPIKEQPKTDTDVNTVADTVDLLSAKSVVGSTITPSLPATSSVSSSMWSITSHDERDFNAGLASLDADIQKLQDSLRCLNS